MESDETPPGARLGIPFVVSGPSGVGKTSLLRRVVDEEPAARFSISHTTRPPREGEQDGRDYRFTTVEKFRALIDEGSFLEWAEYQGNLYGTSRAAVEQVIRRGLDVILEVEVQGARQLRQAAERERGPAGPLAGPLAGAVFAFVLPPSMDALETRLRGRGSDGETAIRKRLAQARDEIKAVVHMYDYVIVNESLDQAVRDLRHVMSASRLQRERVVPLLRDRFDFG
jgi:guanylate kinase